MESYKNLLSTIILNKYSALFSETLKIISIYKTYTNSKTQIFNNNNAKYKILVLYDFLNRKYFDNYPERSSTVDILIVASRKEKYHVKFKELFGS